ncbi:MAG: class I SAM-dependent methyltransferase, partial [Halobacteria archaeon]|nr:class I SAM-dependent methyltransferase [Halobacteria archaeon]
MVNFVCPRCGSSLSPGDEVFVCDSNGATYPVEDGIPDFVSPDEGEGEDRMTKFFDHISAIYETPMWYPIAVRLIRGPSVGETVGWIARRFETAEEVADIATGTGLYARGIAEYADAHVYGIDLSMGMLRKAQTYARRERKEKEIEFARANVESLPFPDDTFDGISCCGALHLFPDKTRA